ncbi:MAG: hypothetical protein K8W52_33065 [Deltaproteobacteria bacterium]|nr:hypothetical protein [Deltaproteobacteria bacterium]
MTSPCDLVAEHLALGEPLGADGDAHVAACLACARLVRMPGLVAAAARPAVVPPGFAARIQVGARAELAARRRNRVATMALAAASVAAVATFAITRQSDAPHAGAMDPWAARQPVASHDPGRELPAAPKPEPRLDHTPDPLTARLVHVADIDDALAPSASWTRIEAPLAPYRHLLDRQGAHR